jgi:lambda family phage tail tape measure protein
MADGLRASAGSADQFTASIARAAKLNDDLATASGNLRLAILEAFSGPIAAVAKLSDEVNNSKAAMESLISVIKAVGIALVIAFTFTGLGLIVRAVGTIGRGIVGLVQLFKALGTSGAGAASKIVGNFGAQSILMKSLRGLAGIISVVIGAFTGIKLFETDETEQIDKTTEALDKQGKVTRDVKAANEEKIRAIREGFTETTKNLQSISEQIALETQLVGKTKEYSDLLRAQRDLTTRTTQEIEKLSTAKQRLTQDELAQGLGTVYDEQIAKIRELSAAEEKRLETLVTSLNEAQRANQFRLFTLQEEYRLTDALREIQDEMAKSTMSEIERKYYDIEVAARKAGDAAIRAEEARIGRRLSEDEARKYYEESARGSDVLKKKQNELYESSRRFSTGWNRAFREYADNAMNAAKRAEDLFRKATQGMEDAIVNFAKTGKFEWKNFVNMMVEELLRAQIQQLFAQVLGTMQGGMAGGGQRPGGGGGDLLGGIGSIFGGIFNSGKKAPGSGGGGGIFETIKNVGGGIIDFGKSIFDGIGSIFGGARANGGPVMGGKSYLVGERGPELFSPGASGMISPNGSFGGTNVTYNINAVDASSFQQLVARDPGFIFAVTEQGRRSYSGAR